MRKFRLLSSSAIGSAALFGMSFAFTAPAYAQDDTDEVQTAQDEVQTAQADTPSAGEQNLTVTGSRIRRPNLESNVPITSVSVEDLTSQGDVSVGDALNDLPSLRSTFSQANSNRFIGTTGLNILDLRGLGVDAHPGSRQRPPPHHVAAGRLPGRRQHHSRATSSSAST